MKFDFNEADKIITNIARKYSRNTSIGYEDFYQDLWVKAIELDTENMAIITKSLVNKAIDISRKSWNDDKYATSNYQNDWNDDDKEEYLFNHGSIQMSDNTDISDYLALLQNIDKLSSKSRSFVISKAYLNGFEEFEDEFRKIMVTIPSERLEILHEYKKDNYSDDIILKVFCGIKTGTNAGSARSIKNEIKEILLG